MAHSVTFDFNSIHHKKKASFTLIHSIINICTNRNKSKLYCPPIERVIKPGSGSFFALRDFLLKKRSRFDVGETKSFIPVFASDQQKSCSSSLVKKFNSSSYREGWKLLTMILPTANNITSGSFNEALRKVFLKLLKRKSPIVDDTCLQKLLDMLSIFGTINFWSQKTKYSIWSILESTTCISWLFFHLKKVNT